MTIFYFLSSSLAGRRCRVQIHEPKLCRPCVAYGWVIYVVPSTSIRNGGNAERQTRQCWQLLTARMAQQKNESTRKWGKLSLALLCFKFLFGRLSLAPSKQATLFALLWLRLQSRSLLPSSQGKRVMANDASALFICHAPYTTHTDTDTQEERQTWRLLWLTRAWVGLNIVSCLCVWHVCRAVLVCVCVCVLALSGFKLGSG